MDFSKTPGLKTIDLHKGAGQVLLWVKGGEEVKKKPHNLLDLECDELRLMAQRATDTDLSAKRHFDQYQWMGDMI